VEGGARSGTRRGEGVGHEVNAQRRGTARGRWARAASSGTVRACGQGSAQGEERSGVMGSSWQRGQEGKGMTGGPSGWQHLTRRLASGPRTAAGLARQAWLTSGSCGDLFNPNNFKFPSILI
jgi:hypothetical protein